MSERSKFIKLFVGNLPYEVTDQEIRNILQGCGSIRFLSVRKDKQTNKSKGYAHIEYRHEWEAVEAFKRLMGKDMRGRVLKVDFCDDFMRIRYSDLIDLANRAFQNASSQPLNVDSMRYTDVSHANIPNVAVAPLSSTRYQRTPYAVTFPDSLTNAEDASNKRERREEMMLIDDEGNICNKEFFDLVKSMTMLDVAHVVDIINEYIEKSVMNTRCILKENPEMAIALVHAKTLLGRISFEKNYSIAPEHELDASLEYFHSKH
ncbi:hypothetical protein BgAZ_304280 [Babesia gibsoni]|uniref:RRM domain-containing protein n=1 Tax=Babesia gibsoni TaxID=33632 RepID=A0AAD8LHS0_BABGI|nr:hypothetical protein BgAZ_304280 [Babesia gibsoni]